MKQRSPQEVIQEAKDYIERWGSKGFGLHLNVTEIVEAAISLLELIPEQGDVISKADLTKVKRELTAAKAREGKLKKQIEELKK